MYKLKKIIKAMRQRYLTYSINEEPCRGLSDFKRVTAATNTKLLV